MASVLVAAMALAGCGGNGSSSSTSLVARSTATTTVSQSTATTAPHRPPLNAIELQIPGLLAERLLPTRYTCDGSDLSIPLRWSGLPHGTAELALFILDVEPVAGKTFVDWAVTGLSPTLHGLPAGRLPAGAVVGRNGFGQDGYSICPERGEAQRYVAALFALPHRLSLKPGFDAAELHQQVERLARVQGLILFRYKRA